MAKTPKPPKNADDKEQSERFIETARELGTDETGKSLEKLFKEVVPPTGKKKPKPSK